ncbi:MAG TPA: hypothetical protein VGC45_03875 [Gryllotalpicola sp.]
MIRTVLCLTASEGDLERLVERYRELDVLRYSLDHSRALPTELSVAARGAAFVFTDPSPVASSLRLV